MGGKASKSDLRAFRRSRWARIIPERAGLPRSPGLPGPSAWAGFPGLRREEVAQLAGVSIDYYVRLERVRNPHASVSVLEAVVGAL
ncbi:helix-turn-helix domain-containing protein [Nocardia sp. Marseille-Q1738]